MRAGDDRRRRRGGAQEHEAEGAFDLFNSMKSKG